VLRDAFGSAFAWDLFEIDKVNMDSHESNPRKIFPLNGTIIALILFCEFF
jgi:hypothetical protein